MRSNCCQRLAASASMPVALGHGTSTSRRLRGECLALGLSSNCLWSCSASGRTQVLSSPGPLDTSTTASCGSVPDEPDKEMKCRWRDLNSQGRSHTPLKRACLPIPPHPRGRLSPMGLIGKGSYRLGCPLMPSRLCLQSMDQPSRTDTDTIRPGLETAGCQSARC